LTISRVVEAIDKQPRLIDLALHFPPASRYFVVAGADGVSVFDALHRRGRAPDAILQAFDLLELDGEELRPLPLGQRKPRLARLLARVPAGIALNEHTDAKGDPAPLRKT
jgi:ATP-dependent DNA ligase